MRTVFVCAHGAGGHKDDRAMLSLSDSLQAIGIEVVRFNFPYREKGSARPDPMPVLKERIAAEVAKAREGDAEARLLIGGRSMGGRAASVLAAEGFACDGLLLLAYPLHPAKQPEKLRDAHLAAIRIPVLCFNGTRDALCARELMDRAVGGLPNWRMHWLEGADHSFRAAKRFPDALAQVAAATREWLDNLPPP